MERDELKNIFRLTKNYFLAKLGKYTHKRVTDDWYYHALGFVKDGMGYVFGFNMGFFRSEDAEDFDYIGMNVTVRRNGENSQLRERFYKFFQENLAEWQNMPERDYSSERGGIGKMFSHYRKISDFNDEDEIVDFIKFTIDELHKIYPKIIQNPGGIFDKVLRAAPQWEDSILAHCNDHVEW